MADRTISEGGVTGLGDASVDAAVDARITAMRQLLDRMALPSTAEALSALRDAFPEAPLGERVRAMRSRRH